VVSHYAKSLPSNKLCQHLIKRFFCEQKRRRSSRQDCLEKKLSTTAEELSLQKKESVNTNNERIAQLKKQFYKISQSQQVFAIFI
jgi:anti-sigma28 factor (negative regulator of flagellin synthesis)